jgi:GDSL-like Lipase/Acylhydrolase family
MKLSPLKRVIFALVAVTGTFAIMLLVLFVADLYAHSRVERSAGLNRQGYRGSVVGRKRPGEVRVVMLGGSTVFGFNVEVEDAIPPQLERDLAAVEPNVRVVNLGYHQEAAISFVPTLRSYAYLDYDIVLLYEGYNDILGDAAPNTAQKRHASPLFRAIGYYPILPQILREKATFLRKGNGPAQVEFHPGLANRTSAAALDVSSAFAEALGRRLDQLVDPVATSARTGPGCDAPWSHYCGSVAAAVRFAREHGKLVLVIGQPRLPHKEAERHASQQRALAAMLARDFGNDAGVRYVDIFDAVDLANNSMDGLHLTGAGNAVVAQRLVGPVREMIALRRAGAGAR